MRVFVMLLLGAIINIAVAWAIAYQARHGDWTFIATTGGGAHYADYVLAEHRFGWPAHSFTNDPDPQIESPRRFAWRVGDRAFPLLPIWPGFAINTVLYAAVLWGLFAAPFALRRRMRIRRGLCPKCAYDLRGSASADACPECGSLNRRLLIEGR